MFPIVWHHIAAQVIIAGGASGVVGTIIVHLQATFGTLYFAFCPVNKPIKLSGLHPQRSDTRSAHSSLLKPIKDYRWNVVQNGS